MKLLNKNFIALLIGHAFSLFGYYLLMFALPFYVLQTTGSPAIFGAISAVAFLPEILTLPIGGIFADRVSKKRIIVSMQLTLSALIFLFIGVSGFVSIIPTIMILMMSMYAIQGLGYPAIDAVIPSIVPESQIVRANGIISFASQMPEFLALILGGVLFATIGLIPIVVICGIFYIVAAGMGMAMKIPHTPQPAAESIPKMIKGDIQITIRFLTKENPQLLKVVIPLALLGLVLLPMIPIGLPILITEQLGMSSEMLGFAMGSAIGIGGVASGIIASTIGDKLKMKDCPKLLLLECVAMLPIGAVFLLNIPIMAAFVIITIFVMLITITASLLIIRLYGYIQIETPEEILGKVVSVVTALTMCIQPLGFFLYGIMFQRLQDTPWVVIFSAALVSLGIAIYAARHFKKL